MASGSVSAAMTFMGPPQASHVITGDRPAVSLSLPLANSVHLENSGQEASPFHTMPAPRGLTGLATTTVLTDFGQ